MNDEVGCAYCELDKDGRHEEYCIYYNPVKVVQIPDGTDLPRRKRRLFYDEVRSVHVHKVGTE